MPRPEVTPAQGTRARVKGDALFIAERFGGWDGDGVTGRQQAGKECAESEEPSGCEQTACGKGALHPVGENRAEKAIQCNTDDNARGRADEPYAPRPTGRALAARRAPSGHRTR